MVEKQAVAEYKQERITEAAQKRFAHYGLEKTTMNEIAEDIGISKALLYYYFKDKESIFKEVVLKEQSFFCTHMKSLIESNKPVTVVLKDYIEKRTEYLKMLLNLGKLRYEAFRATKPLFADLGRIFQEHEKKIIMTILKHALKKKEIANIDVDEYSDFFISTLRAIRLYELDRKELWDKGNIDKEIKHKHLLFTDIFLKSIEIK
jgi:TetR/AcrR family transcriptional regulator